MVISHRNSLPGLTLPLHHAYCITGEAEQTIPRILDFLKQELGFEARGNPDFWRGEYETLGIDEARSIAEASARRALGPRKIFIISARALTREAQNALLKTFEEPTPDTHFFLFVPSPALLFPTVRSRLCIISARIDMAADAVSAAGQFLAASLPARLAQTQNLLKELEREKKEKEDRTEPLVAKGRIIQFLSALEAALAKDTKANAAALAEVLTAKKYARDRAPSLKLLLEHLALVLPKV